MLSVNYNKTLLLGKQVEVTDLNSLSRVKYVGRVTGVCTWEDGQIELYLTDLEPSAVFKAGWVRTTDLLINIL